MKLQLKLQPILAASASAVLAVLAAAPLAAQRPIDPQCSAVTTQDACQKAIDIFQYLAPQLGVVIAGGNATLGVGGTVGGLGHIYISGRANIVSSNVPRVDLVTPSTTGARSDEYPTQSQIAGIPEADVAVGLFRGIPLGVTNVGGIDLLGSLSYFPSIDASGVHLSTPNGSFKVGGGVRVGLIQEGLVLPGIAVTYLRRGLPTVNVSANNTAGDSLRIRDIDITTDSYRIVASKTLMMLGIAIGGGQDRFNSNATADASVAARSVGGIATPAATVGPIGLSQKFKRTTYFLDATLNLPIIKIVGEIGRTNSVGVPTYNSFAGAAAGAALTYGALGVRFGL